RCAPHRGVFRHTDDIGAQTGRTSDIMEPRQTVAGRRGQQDTTPTDGHLRVSARPVTSVAPAGPDVGVMRLRPHHLYESSYRGTTHSGCWITRAVSPSVPAFWPPVPDGTRRRPARPHRRDSPRCPS